ncbi:hypothetical protein ACFL2A_04860, partial [Thermodesulfobacteriota bacterium]
MALSLINNIAAIGAQRSLATASNKLGNSLARLSSGLRINSAKDDPSGLAISERFRTQIRGLARASLNAQDAISFLQTAEGALNESHSILQRMRELAVQAANGVLTSNDRLEIQKEVDQLSDEINRIANSTEFNTKKLLDGSGAALWSADSTDISAVITGLVAEGNYRLEKNNEPTVNHVIKTDIFSVKSGAQGVTDLDLNEVAASLTMAATDGVAGTGYTITFNFGGADISTTYTSGASTTLTATAAADAINADSNLSPYIVATSSVANLTITAKDTGVVGNSYSVSEPADQFTVITAAATNLAGGLDSSTGITAIDNPNNLPAGTGYSVLVDAVLGAANADQVDLVDTHAQTGSTAAWSTAAVAESGTIVNDTFGNLILEVVSTAAVCRKDIASCAFREARA